MSTHPRWDSNPQSLAPETNALSIRPLGLSGDGTSSGTRTRNLTLRRGAPYPLGHGGDPSRGVLLLDTTFLHFFLKMKKGPAGT